jgi:glycosyltransferase involved in cell wall biosynthesis
VPIIEAMYFGKPIVALKAAAVPGTMGGAGLLLDEADPAIAGTAIDRIMRDEELREALKTQREIQIRKFTYEVVSQRMKKLIMDFASADATKGLSDRPLETFGHDI